MVISTKGSVECNFMITNKNAIDMNGGKSVSEAFYTRYEQRTAWCRITYYLSASAKI